MDNKDVYTEVTSEGWGSRIMGSIGGVLFGIIMFLAAFVVLWWNEGRAVRTAEGLEEGAGSVVAIDAMNVDPSNQGKLVHLSGEVNTEEKLTDEEFNVDVQALKLERVVEMYQWEEEAESETKKKVGGSEETTTTYRYNKVWSTSHNSSDDFKITEGHINPAGFPVDAYTKQVQGAKIGDFELNSTLISNISNFTNYKIKQEDVKHLKDAKVITDDNVTKIYMGKGSFDNPQVGDVKVSFKVVMPGNYSIVSRQNNNTFEPYQTHAGTSIQMISSGVVSAENMFDAAQSSNTITTWILRLVGLFVMYLGLCMIFKPLVVIADVLPFLGSLLDLGLSFFAGIISFTLSFVTIATAWIYYRPVVGISLLVIGLGTFAFFYWKSLQKKKLKMAVAEA